MKNRQSFDQRVNAWLQESAGEQFRRNKWKFWFVALVAFQVLNSILTAMVFRSAGNLQQYMGAILLGVGTLLGWLGVGFLHYSDGHDRRLARGVSWFDSATLICVVTHFCFLLWVYGHLSMLQNAEAEFKAQAKEYNQDAIKVSDNNVKIVQGLQAITETEKQVAKLENDTAYQARKAAERGAKVQTGRTSGSSVAGNISTQTVELEKPEKPAESSVAYLARWDALIRFANYGELLLAVLTLIYIRTRTAKTNTAPSAPGYPSPIEPTYTAPARSVGFARGAQDEPGPKARSDRE